MTQIRKVLTKADALAEANYISKTLACDPTHPAHGGICSSWHSYHRIGNVSWTYYGVSGQDFDVKVLRSGGRDGQIRHASNEVRNSLAFALFCVEHFPLRQRSIMWAERLLDEKLVLGTMDRRVREWFVMPGRLTIADVKEAYAQAILLERVAA